MDIFGHKTNAEAESEWEEILSEWLLLCSLSEEKYVCAMQFKLAAKQPKFSFKESYKCS